MGDADLFAKLNRILETHNLSNDGDDNDDFLERFSYDIGVGSSFPNTSAELKLSTSSRPSPFEVWKSRQVDTSKKRMTPKLSSQDWDGLVNHLHKTSKLKESAVMKEQNDGLAAEFSGHQFKPSMNKKSEELMSNKRTPLHQRCDAIVAEHEEKMTRKRIAKAESEVEECSFKPTRQGEATSDKYLKKLGRQSGKGSVDPEYFFKYHEEKLRRNAIRQQIVSEMTARELTFTPSLNTKSQSISNKLKRAQLISEGSVNSTPRKFKSGNTSASASATGTPRGIGGTPRTPSTPRNAGPGVHPFSSLSKRSTQKILDQPNKLLSESGLGDPTHGDYFGAPVVVESSHPYKHNANEYTIVHIHGAISYSITFDEQTRTEAIHDYVKFFTDDRHTDYYGCGKYCGGQRLQANSKYFTKDEEANPKYSSSNWCGLGGRPPLIIPASRFVVCFRSNGAVNDWGFKLYATPLISGNINNVLKDDREGHPTISNRGRLFGNSNRGSFASADASNDSSLAGGASGAGANVFDRLHKEAVLRSTTLHNQQAALVKSKLNISTKPWEATRATTANGTVVNNAWTQSKTHHSKGGGNTDITDLLVKKGGKDGALENNGALITTQGILSREYGSGKTPAFAIFDYEDEVVSLWKNMRAAQPNPNFVSQSQGAYLSDDENDENDPNNRGDDSIPEL